MTGYGRGSAAEGKVSCTAEIRSINSRYLEVSARLPKVLSHRENDVKELIRSKITRGKVTVSINLVSEIEGELSVRINPAAVKAYTKLLTDLKKKIKSSEKIGLDHLLQFPEILESREEDESDEREWAVARRALAGALDSVVDMRQREGGELKKDLEGRVTSIGHVLNEIERLAASRAGEERERLQERIKVLAGDVSVIDNQRLELEIALLVDRLDVTEECVRFRSHNKFFLEGLGNVEAAGRRLNFLVQEMNREANTIGSKSNSAEIAHLVVGIKEELEKVREQLQNIE